MINIDSEKINAVKTFVSNLLNNQLSKNCIYHTIKHTLDVLQNVVTIGTYCNLNEPDLNIVRLSALFHDTGYIKGIKGHEAESIKIARDYLQQHNLSDKEILKITDAIQATIVPQDPKDKYGEILCDADLMHLTYDNYFENMELLRKEWELMGMAKMTDYEFHLNSLQFFFSHNYHSEYGKKILTPKKEKNLILIENKLKELKALQ